MATGQAPGFLCSSRQMLWVVVRGSSSLPAFTVPVQSQPWWNPVSDLCVLEPDHNPLRSRFVVRQSSSVPVFTLLVQSQPTALVGSGLGSRPVPVVRNLTIPLRGRVLADCLQMLSEAKGLHSSCLFTEMHLLISALQLPEQFKHAHMYIYIHVCVYAHHMCALTHVYMGTCVCVHTHTRKKNCIISNDQTSK